MRRSSITMLLVVAFAALIVGDNAHASLPVLTVAQYSAQVARIEAAIKADRAGTSTLAPATVTPVQCIVRTDSPSDNIFVDNRSLLADINDAESAKRAERQSKLDSLIRRLDNLSASISAQTPTADQAASGLKAGRDTLLSGRFASDPVPPDSQVDKISKAITDWWNALMKRIKFHGPTIKDPHINPEIPLAILIVILVGAVGILIWYLVGFVRSRSILPRKAKLETNLALDEEEAELVAARAFDKLLDLAAQRAASDDYRSAFRLVFVASLVALDTDGVVRLNRSSTNWEYLRILRANHPAFYEILLPMTRDFDRIWYGFRPASSEDYEAALEKYDALRQTAKVPTGATVVAAR